MTTYIPPTVLYIKQHSVTGLKYFGKTTAKDPLKYKGSGVDWRLHLKEHGSENIITTIVFGPCTDSIVISEFALAFSKEHNIVKSKDWANIKPENGLDGNSKGSTHSDESKQKMSDAKKGKPQSPEHKQKRSDAMTGKTQSPEHKQKLSDAKKGKTHSAETKQKISGAKKGQTHSDDSKQKMSDAKKGKPGKPHSAETRQKMSDAKKKKSIIPILP